MAARGDIYSRIKKDHDEMKRMMKKVSSKFDEQTFNQLAEELDSHQAAEERVFYPSLIQAQQTHELALEAKEEHHVANLLLRELRTNAKGTDVWQAKFTVLQENVLHHIQEEESKVFPSAQKVLSADQAKQMTQQFEEQKQGVLV
jgi:iron-sulfur cluster repair protein YtfE (RIC family)